MPAVSNQIVTVLPKGIQTAGDRIPNLSVTGTTSKNLEVGNAYETVHVLGGLRNVLSTAQVLKIKSTDADDTNSGSKAARRVRVRGLLADGTEVQEQVNLNGTNFVATTNEFLRINQVKCDKFGTQNDVNEGTITVYANDETTALAQIEPTEVQAALAHYTAPSGTKGYITSFFANIVGTAEVAIVVKKGDRADRGWERKMTVIMKDNGQPYEMPNPFVVEASDTIEFRAKSLVDGETAIVNIDFQVIVES